MSGHIGRKVGLSMFGNGRWSTASPFWVTRARSRTPRYPISRIGNGTNHSESKVSTTSLGLAHNVNRLCVTKEFASLVGAKDENDTFPTCPEGLIQNGLQGSFVSRDVVTGLQCIYLIVRLGSPEPSFDR